MQLRFYYDRQRERELPAQNDWHQLLDQASSTGKLLAKPGISTEQILHEAQAIGVGHPRHDFLVQRTLWTVVGTRLGDRKTPVEDALAVAAKMNPDRPLGNSLADTGEELAKIDGLQEKGHAVLRFAADVFTSVWDKAKEDGNLNLELLEDYVRVTERQSWAKDAEGAEVSARAVTTRLLEWEEKGAIENVEDEDMDEIKRELLTCLDADDPIYARLYDTLKTDEARKDIDQVIAAEKAFALLRAGEVEAAFSEVRDVDAVGILKFLLVPHLYRLISDGDYDTANSRFDSFLKRFPEEFEGDQYVGLSFIPLTEVLVALDRHELLASMIEATIPEDGDNNSSDVEMLAMRAGVVFAGDDSKDFGRFKDLLPEAFREKAQEGFDLLVKEHQEQK